MHVTLCVLNYLWITCNTRYSINATWIISTMYCLEINDKWKVLWMFHTDAIFVSDLNPHLNLQRHNLHIQDADYTVLVLWKLIWPQWLLTQKCVTLKDSETLLWKLLRKDRYFMSRKYLFHYRRVNLLLTLVMNISPPKGKDGNNHVWNTLSAPILSCPHLQISLSLQPSISNLGQENLSSAAP